MKEKKEFSRSIRMTNTVYIAVESMPGNGFNEKFQNMVLKCIEELPKIENEINEKQNRLKEINKKIFENKGLLLQLENIKYGLDAVFNRVKQV